LKTTPVCSIVMSACWMLEIYLEAPSGLGGRNHQNPFSLGHSRDFI
jgi:hypothetical protein